MGNFILKKTINLSTSLSSFILWDRKVAFTLYLTSHCSHWCSPVLLLHLVENFPVFDWDGGKLLPVNNWMLPWDLLGVVLQAICLLEAVQSNNKSSASKYSVIQYNTNNKIQLWYWISHCVNISVTYSIHAFIYE